MYNSIYNIDNDIINNNNENDDEDDVKVNMNCKYYGTEDFSKAKFNENKTFSVFHLNILQSRGTSKS